MKRKNWEWRLLSPTSKLFVICTYVLMTLITLAVLLPLLYVLQMTFSSDLSYGFRLLPKGFTLRHYETIFTAGMITKPLTNSILVTMVSVFISMLLTVTMAYPLSRKDLVCGKHLNFIVMLPMMISLGFMPTYMLVQELHLMNTYWALILPGAISTYNLIIMRNFFSSIPASLIESAQLDGASEMKILFSIVIPLSKPSIATISLFYMVSSWNEYFNVILFIRDKGRQTLHAVLQSSLTARLKPPLCAITLMCAWSFRGGKRARNVSVSALRGARLIRIILGWIRSRSASWNFWLSNSLRPI